jgi:concanavalin A-like lectin/glucanase superfamily protein
VSPTITTTYTGAVTGAGGSGSCSTVLTVTPPSSGPSGLIAAYEFSAGAGTTIADSSGNNLNGTATSTTWTTAGRYGNALSFNGTSSYVNLGNPVALQATGSMSWTAWVKATSTPADDGQIVARSGGTSGWQFKTSPDTGPHTFGIMISGSTGIVQRYSTTVRALNTWYHVAAVYNAAARTLDIYVNGALDNGVLLGTIPAAQTVPSTNVNIGRRSGGYYFAGILDDLRIYGRALTADEIRTVMTTPIP